MLMTNHRLDSSGHGGQVVQSSTQTLQLHPLLLTSRTLNIYIALHFYRGIVKLAQTIQKIRKVLRKSTQPRGIQIRFSYIFGVVHVYNGEVGGSNQLLIRYANCEAQGKGRANGRPRKVTTQRSFIDGGWWMVDILSLMLYIKFGCHHHQKSLNLQD